MQTGARALVPLLKASDNFTAWSEKLESVLMLTQPQALDKWLTKEPDASDQTEVKQDLLCLATIKLYVHESLSSVIRGCKSAKQAYESLQKKLLHAMEIRRQSCHTSIAALRQGRQSVNAYLDSARDLICEAQDVGQTSLMSLLCSQVVTGLNTEYLQALGDNLLSHIESNLTSTSSEEEIMKVFDNIEQRIRARCKQYLHSQRAEDNADEEKAAMFQVGQEGLPQPPPQQ
jgi:hypothetical protein